MAAQRLRRTFKYPSESDDEDAVEAGMDEQDQATLIKNLTATDKSTTHTYTLALLILPLTLSVAYIPRLFTADPIEALKSLIAIASLLASAYTLYYLPLPPQDPLEEKTESEGRPKNVVPSWEKIVITGRRPVPWLSEDIADLLADYIVVVNRAVCGVLALLELRSERSWMEGVMLGGGYLPLVVCMIIVYARTELRIIDMDALEMLRKGEKSR